MQVKSPCRGIIDRGKEIVDGNRRQMCTRGKRMQIMKEKKKDLIIG